MAGAGWSVGYVRSNIDTLLAARPQTPEYIMFNLGANDVDGDSHDVLADGTGATWQSNLAYIIDAVHTKWPDAQIYFMRPWERGDATKQAKLDLIGDILIPAVMAGRDYCHLGPDERVFLENGDDGVTYTSDGTHPNEAGQRLTAAQWVETLGY